jgi:hypothetical protein
MYILLPTPDELFIYPVGSFFFSVALHMPFVYALVLTMIIYRGIGAACLIGALLIGGKPIYYNLKERYRKRRIQPLSKRLGHL